MTNKERLNDIQFEKINQIVKKSIEDNPFKTSNLHLSIKPKIEAKVKNIKT
tara:strand:+ start:535 stop:687 length:153 start_codon:yes stop_codon:yes gene_type:complete